MNIRTLYVLIAILAIAATISVSPAFAEQQACPDCEGVGKESAKQARLSEIPISVWTDKSTYASGTTILVEGKVANIRIGEPVTLTVTNPTYGNIVTIDQLDVDSNGMFSTTLNTASSLWKSDGTYKIQVQYGIQGINNSVLVELIGGPPGVSMPPTACAKSELAVDGRYCVPYTISGGTVTSAKTNTKDNSIVVSISSTTPGTLTINPSTNILSGVFMVLVDNQEWNDVEITQNKITVMFPAGTEKIEFIGTFVIPEFGTIAALILAVAIISIIAVTAKTRLRVMPKY